MALKYMFYGNKIRTFKSRPGYECGIDPEEVEQAKILLSPSRLTCNATEEISSKYTVLSVIFNRPFRL
jgi:hypothetical protein